MATWHGQHRTSIATNDSPNQTHAHSAPALAYACSPASHFCDLQGMLRTQAVKASCCETCSAVQGKYATCTTHTYPERGIYASDRSPTSGRTPATRTACSTPERPRRGSKTHRAASIPGGSRVGSISLQPSRKLAADGTQTRKPARTASGPNTRLRDTKERLSLPPSGRLRTLRT